MRVRSLLTLSAGAALGAGWMYLNDPDHGQSRRREVRRTAWRSAKDGAVRTAFDAGRRAEELALAAVQGFAEGQADRGSRAIPAASSLQLVDPRRVVDPRRRR